MTEDKSIDWDPLRKEAYEFRRGSKDVIGYQINDGKKEITFLARENVPLPAFPAFMVDYQVCIEIISDKLVAELLDESKRL